MIRYKAGAPYKPEPLTREMIRVMQDWHGGPDSMFFKVSIGVTEEKKVHPVVKKHFDKIGLEVRQALREMTDQTADEMPDDVKALQDLMSWATRQTKRLELLDTLGKAAVGALAYYTKDEIESIVADALYIALLPND